MSSHSWTAKWSFIPAANDSCLVNVILYKHFATCRVLARIYQRDGPLNWYFGSLCWSYLILFLVFNSGRRTCFDFYLKICFHLTEKHFWLECFTCLWWLCALVFSVLFVWLQIQIFKDITLLYLDTCVSKIIVNFFW